VDIKKIYEYPHIEYLHRYEYGYETDIYPADRLHESYYPYPTRPIDIRSYNLSFSFQFGYLIHIQLNVLAIHSNYIRNLPF